MKVSELTGEALDYWVARAANIAIKRRADGFLYTDEDHPKLWQPSNFWDTAGPIIERERIGIFEGAQWPEPGTPPAQWVWYACVDGAPNYGTNLESYDHPTVSGPTPRIAAMRAFVASKFGEEVPDESL
jgi:hypothetical protein